jgi:nitrite reductase/ring-hydroxylating ferredoxin subunit
MAERRTVLKGILGAGLTAVAAPILYVFGRYISFVKTTDLTASIKIAAAELSADTPSKIVNIDEEPVIVVMEEQGIRAFSAKCTHLGCTVSFRPQQPGFFCKCHKGRYDLDGVNIPGTRPKHPLTELTVTENGDDLEISLMPKKKV